MPIYEVQGPDGRIYEVEGPEGASEQQIVRFLQQQLATQPAAPKQQGSWFGDVARSFGLGATGATGALTSVFGADNVASEKLGQAGEALQAGLSTERQAELQRQAARMKRAEESGSTWEEVKAGLLNIIEAPVQSTAQALGSFVPMVATLPLAKLGLGTGAMMAVRGAIGGAQGAGAVKQNVYDAVLQAELDEGKPEAQAQAAAARAQSYVSENLDQILLGTGLGVVAGTTGVERILPGGARAQAGAVQDAIAKRIGQRATSAGATALGEMPLEGLQGGQERLAANLALQRTDRDVDTFTGVAGQATQEALMGGLGGATLGAALPDRRREIAEREAAEAERQRLTAERAAQAEQEQKEREAYEASPAYLLDIERQFLDTRGQLAELQRQKRKIDSKSETAEEDREFNKQLEAQIKALREETGYKDLLSQYTTLRPRIERAKEQAALDALSPEEFMLRQQGLGVDTRRPFKREKPVPLSAAAEKGADVSGIAPAQPMLPAEVPLFYAQQQIEAANRQAREQAISDQPELAMAGFDAAEGVQATGQQIIEALTTDLGMANTLLRTRPQLPGMSRSQSKLVLDGLQTRMNQIGAEIDTGRQQAQARRAEIEREIQTLQALRNRTDGADTARLREFRVRQRELQAELDEIEQQAAMTRDAEAQLGLFEEGLEVPEQELPAGMEAVPLSRRRRIGNVEVDGALPLPQQIRQLKQQRAAAVQTRNNALVRDIDEAIDILNEGEPAEREAAPTGQVADLQAALADMARSTEPEGRQPVAVPETTSPDMLEDLIARADQNPELPLQDQMLLEQVRDELPVLNRMQPVGEAEGLTPARPLDIVSSWLYRSNTGNPSPEARREVEDLLARIEQGKRSETEQVRQAAGRALTPQEQRQVRGTSLEGRRGIMTREDTGETRRQVQTDLAEEDLGTIFQDFVDFDNFMASEGLAQLRDSQELFGETAARTAKLVAPLQNRVAEINSQMAALRQRIVDARTAAVDQRNQALAAVEQERAKVAKILVEADKPLAAFDAAYLQAYFNLAQATTARADLTREMRDNAAQLEARIAAFETNQANKQALQKASKEFKQALENLVSERQKEQDALRVLNTSRFPDYQAYFKAKEGRLNKEGMAELQAKAEAAHKAVAAAMKAIDPTLRLDSKVFKDFLIKEAALTEQLRANARRLGGLTVTRNRAKKAMLEARAEVFNEPALVKRIEDAKLDEQTAEILLQSAIANENVDVKNFVRTLEQQIQELQPFADTLATRIKELNEAARRRRDERARRDVPVTDEGKRRVAEQERLEVLQGTRAEELGLLDRIQVTFPKEREKRVDSKYLMKLYENRTFARAYAAVAPADKKQEALAAREEAERVYDEFVNGQSENERKRIKSVETAAEKFIEKDNELREFKPKVAEVEAERALVQAEIDARKETGAAPLKKQTDKLAAMDRKVAKAKAKQAQLTKDVQAALDKVKRVSGIQATYKADAKSSRLFDNAEEQIAAIAAGQTSRRVTSPVTRSSSPAPTQFRTESPESRAGASRAEVDRRAKESTQPKPRDTKVSAKEQREANRIAEEQRGKGTGQKVAGITEAEAQRAALTATKAGMKSEPKKLPAEFVEANKIAAALRNPKKKENSTLLRQEVEKARNTARELKELFDESDFSEGDFDALESAVRDTVYDSRPTYDLRANTAEAVEDGRILDALQTLESNGSTDFVKQLAARLRPLVMRTKLRVVDNLTNQKGVPVEGLFSPENNTVFLDRNGLNEESFLHEVTHAVTINALRVDPASLTPAQRQAVQELRSLYEQVQSEPAFKNEYAKKSLEEFVAELMSNQQVRTKLDAQQPSLLRRIYNSILEMLGMKPMGRSEKAVQDAYAIFAPSKPSQGAVVASVMRGVFPGHKPVFNESAPASFRKSLTRTAADVSFGDKLSSFMLGMRTKTADQWAAREALTKLGLEGGKLDEAAATQSRIYMRLNSEANRFAHQALLDAPLALVKDEKGYFGVGVDEKRPGYAKVLETLRGAVGESGLENMEAVEGVFQKLLQVERAETDGIGYDKINTRDPMTPEEARRFKADIASNPKLKKTFDEARTAYRNYNDGMLDFAKAAGVFTAQEVATFKKGNYVPFYRLNESTGNVTLEVGATSRTVGNIINQPQLKELVGGEKAFLGLSESVLQNTQMLTRMALQNLQGRDVGFMLQKLGLGKVMDGEGTANTIRFKIDGKPKWVKLETDLFPPDIPAEILLQGLHGVKAAVPTALQLAGIPTNLLRATIVRMPLYIIRQMIRDPLHAWFTTGLKFTPVVSSIKELTKIRQGLSENEVKLMRSGAISSNVMTGDFNDAARTLRDLTAKGNPWNKTMAALDNAAMQADASTRAVLYDRYRQQGMSHFEAALGAAEVMNFQRRGTSSSLYMMSTLVPFFNAQIQGVDSIYRGFKGDTVFENQLKVRNSLVRRSVFMLGLTLAYAVAMQDDEAYKNATPQEKAMNWFLPVPGIDASVRVPIPFEIGILTKAIPEILYNAGFGDASSEDTLKGLRFALGMSVPSVIPTAVQPLLELATNYSFFRDAPIETQRDKLVAPELRYRETTTELAKVMGDVAGVSPLQIEHFVRGYTSTAGILALSMFNPILRPFAPQERGEKVEKRITETPFFGAAFQPNTGRGIIDSVYADVEDWQQAAGTFKRLVEEGRLSEARAYADKKSREIALSSTGGSFRQLMGQIAEMRRAIEANPEMSAKEKRDRIEDLKKYQIRLAEKIRELAKAGE